MGTQQIVMPPTQAAMFLVYTVQPNAQDRALDLLTSLPGITRTVGFRKPEGELTTVAGIGSDLWDRMLPQAKPKKLAPFQPIQGAKYTAPATPGDLLLHLRAQTLDLCYQVASLVEEQYGDILTVVDETHGFQYFDHRDLLGFVDGTENPDAQQDLREAALVSAEEDPQFAGGSYVMVQKYLHNMQAWRGLHVEQQEDVIGRTKLDNVELSEQRKPANSHVALNDLPDDANGKPQKIYRLNMPFSSFQHHEKGTYFIGYAHDPSITLFMLHNMFVGTKHADHDALLDFSTALTGTSFFAPSIELLEHLDELR